MLLRTFYPHELSVDQTWDIRHILLSLDSPHDSLSHFTNFHSTSLPKTRLIVSCTRPLAIRRLIRASKLNAGSLYCDDSTRWFSILISFFSPFVPQLESLETRLRVVSVKLVPSRLRVVGISSLMLDFASQGQSEGVRIRVSSYFHASHFTYICFTVVPIRSPFLPSFVADPQSP